MFFFTQCLYEFSWYVVTSSCFIRAARCDNATAVLIFCCCFFSFLFFSFFIQREISAVIGRSPRNCHMIGNGCNLKKVQNLGILPRKNLGPKTCFFRPDFGRLRISIANISGTNKILIIGKRRCKLRSLPRLLT